MMASISKRLNQHGFALVMVLMILLILAFIVGALLRNQTLALRETSDVLTSSKRMQESHNIHRQCLAHWRTQMQRSNLEKTQVLNWSEAILMTEKTTKTVNTQNVEGTCQIFAGKINSAKDQLNSWVPRFQVVTTVNGNTEISEWRYSECGDLTATCFNASTQIIVKTIDKDPVRVTIIPQFLLDDRVQTTWRIKR